MGDKIADQIGIAFVGCGAHGREIILPVTLDVPEARVVVACDLDERKGREAAATAGCRWSPDYREAIAGPEVDAVMVVGPPGLHYEVGRAALAAGKHVFCEKPPARTSGELQELAGLARAGGLVTLVGHNFRYASALRAAEAAMKDGSFGRPIGLSLDFLANKPRGVLWDLDSPARSLLLAQGVHALDVVYHLLGPVDLAAASLRLGANGASLLTVSLTSATANIQVNVGSCSPAFEFRLQTSTDLGCTMTIDGLSRVRIKGDSGGSDPKAAKTWSRLWESGNLEPGHTRAGYKGEIVAFLSAVRGCGQARPSFEDELQLYALIDAIELMLTEESRGRVRPSRPATAPSAETTASL